MKTISYLSPKGQLSTSCKQKIPDTTLVDIYKAMVLTRYVDERMLTLQRQGTITFSMSSRGEEACSVASAAALKLDDWMFPQYREVGIMFWRGYSPQDFIHHMFCNGKDIIKGRQMPNHFGSRKLNVVTVSSPIATQIPQAAGTAYAMKVSGEKNVCIAYFGDGSTSKGDFHTALNFASLKKVPAIFFCRNNGYAISTPLSKQCASENIAVKGSAYNMKSVQVDGNDVFALYETVLKAREYCIQGKGPVLIEAMTYRLGAHSTSDDPSQYREDKEVQKWETLCPILRLRLHLESKKLWSEKQEQLLQKELKEQIDTAIEEAKKTPPPPLDSIVQDVYFEVPPELEKQLHEVKTLFS